MNRVPRGPAAPGQPPRIFLNYRRDDAAAYAGRLYDSLAERFGEANVFMDVDTIALGRDFVEAIEHALASCDAVVTVIGRRWLDATDPTGQRRLDDPADVLRLELERALSLGLPVIPVCVQGAPLPKEDELPASLAPLARRQGIELRDEGWRGDVASLVQRLEQAVRPAGPAARTTGTLSIPSRRRRVLVSAALIFTVAAVAVVSFVRSQRDGGTDAGTAMQRLLAAVPEVVRPSCTTIDWGPATALASVSCQGAEVVSVNYFLFESRRLLDGWYAIERENASVAVDTGSCSADDFRGEGAYEVDGARVGRRFCFLAVTEPTMVWTDDEALVGARANVWRGTGAAAAATLLDQWSCCLEPQR